MTQIAYTGGSMQNISNLTVLILAAGYGRRMGSFSRLVNKSLVPYDNKPLISHIMDKFPGDTKFVIAVGNLGHQVKKYVSHVHAEKNVIFVDIPNFDEGTTGPATTIRYCAEYLPHGFLCITCDTLFEFSYLDKLDHNWIAVSPVDSSVSQDYCWIQRDGAAIVAVHNKIKSLHAVDAFIGLMYVNDSKFIFDLEQRNAKDIYEGFDNLNLKAYTVKSWKDFGTYDKWKHLSEGLAEVSFPKPDELFYHDNDKIIKFTTNVALAEAREHRARLNPECMPTDVTHSGNFLFYNYIPGETLYTCLTPELFVKFLDWAETKLWKPAETSSDTFGVADSFYRMKTLDRLEKFRIKYSTWSEMLIVNGRNVKYIEEYIENIDSTWLASKTKWCFIHGDMQFDNIIYDKEADKFTAIDWRPDFAGSYYGDMYYDLAKMLGGLYLSYKSVKEDMLSYEETDDQAIINIPSVENVEVYVRALEEWVMKHGLDWNKVKTLVPVIYLNMAPLHEPPFDKYLIALSQLFFSEL